MTTTKTHYIAGLTKDASFDDVRKLPGITIIKEYVSKTNGTNAVEVLSEYDYSDNDLFEYFVNVKDCVLSLAN